MLPIRHAARTSCLRGCALRLGFGLNPSLPSPSPQFSTLEPPAAASTSQVKETIDTVGSLTKELVTTFKEWFQLGNNALFSRIFEILSADEGPDHSASDHALSLLELRVSEFFVLDVLKDGRKRPGGVLLCLKFFDWAGRQPQFNHTRATFHAMFKILSRAKRESQMMEFVEDIERNVYKLKFRDTLVMGYALAGKLDIALHLFGRMRFNGTDLDSYAYQVLLNALVEDNCFDAVKVLEKQVLTRGLDNAFIHSITVKSLCKRNELDQAAEYLDDLRREGKELDVCLLAPVVTALCKRRKFNQAQSLIEEFRELGVERMENIYSIWLRELIRAGELNRAYEHIQSRKLLEGYIPDVFRYNMLIYNFLRRNRFWDVFDLLMEMKDNGILPDQQTINVTLCFFCKIGMVEVALDLYNSCSDFIFSPGCMFYNFLINALCSTNNTDEAYEIWKSSITSGYFPGKKSFSILIDALYRDSKLDEMVELVTVALQKNFVPSASTYDKFISALCKAKRVEEGYELHREVSKIPNSGLLSSSFVHLIRALIRCNKGDMAATALIEMQMNGHLVQRSLYKSVIQCLINMDNPMTRVLSLLEMQLSFSGPSIWFFHFFINGVGSAKHPELAREIYEIMKRTGITPNVTSDLLVLKAYLKSGRILDALNFYGDIKERRPIRRRIYSTMVSGLCEAGNTDYAMEFFKEMRRKEFLPSIECYEVLIRQLCSNRLFNDAVKVVEDFRRAGRRITSFIGNTLLWHSLETQRVYDAWLHAGLDMDELSDMSMLGRLLGASSGRISMVAENVRDVEEVIGECFPLDLYTYNILLKILSEANDINTAIQFVDWMCRRGLVPNRWTYDIVVRGLLRQGRRAEAKRWYEEMSMKGFTLSRRTRLLL